MPNYCDNILTIYAKGDVLELAKSVLFKNSEPKEDNFTFTIAVPMPDELRYTNSPNTIISDEEYKEREKNGTTRESRNELFTTYYHTQAHMYDFRRKYGATNWYDWAWANWGTKWDADCYSVSVSENSIVVGFTTAWNPPVGWLESLCDKFHNEPCTIELEYVEESMELVGRYTFADGELDHCEGSVVMVDCFDNEVTYDSQMECWTNDEGDPVPDDFVEQKVIY